MLEAQKKMRAEKAQLAKDLKNAQRRRARLKHKARLLSASDLASVLVLRQEEEEQKTKAAAKRRRRSSQPGPRDGQRAEELASDIDDGERPPEPTRDIDDEDAARDTADPPAQT